MGCAHSQELTRDVATLRVQLAELKADVRILREADFEGLQGQVAELRAKVGGGLGRRTSESSRGRRLHEGVQLRESVQRRESSPRMGITESLPETSPIERYAAFISHAKADAALAARFLQTQLEAELKEPVFLDSDDLRDLRQLQEHVRQSDVVIMLQSAHFLSRPFCLLELHAAIMHDVPIIGVAIDGTHGYDFVKASAFLEHLDSRLDAQAAGMLAQHGVTDLRALSYQLSMTLPKIISVPFSQYASRNALVAFLHDVLEARSCAKPPRSLLEGLVPLELWCCRRGRCTPPTSPAAPPPPPSAAPSAVGEPAVGAPTVPAKNDAAGDAIRQRDAAAPLESHGTDKVPVGAGLLGVAAAIPQAAQLAYVAHSVTFAAGQTPSLREESERFALLVATIEWMLLRSPRMQEGDGALLATICTTLQEALDVLARVSSAHQSEAKGATSGDEPRGAGSGAVLSPPSPRLMNAAATPTSSGSGSGTVADASVDDSDALAALETLRDQLLGSAAVLAEQPSDLDVFGLPLATTSAIAAATHADAADSKAAAASGAQATTTDEVAAAAAVEVRRRAWERVHAERARMGSSLPRAAAVASKRSSHLEKVSQELYAAAHMRMPASRFLEYFPAATDEAERRLAVTAL